MLIAYLIHAVELTVIALFAVLALQVNRCYRAEHLDFVNVRSKQEPSLHQEPPVLDERIIISEEYLGKGVVTPVVEKKVKHSEAILNDYIGEFFGETAAPSLNIEQYKVAQPERVVAPAVVSAEDELADDIITVMEDDHKIGKGHSVMSEKVVHAMLDEAKVVCSS